jgi:C4-dicarboxylate-specific signal transduction histidine kinase
LKRINNKKEFSDESIISFKYPVFSKIFFLVFSIIIFFGILAIVVVYYSSYNSIISSEKDHILSSNSLYAKIIEQRFQDAEKVVKDISQREEIVDHFKVEHDHASHVQNSPITLYLEHYNVADEFEAIYIMDNSGLVVASTEVTFLNQDYSFRDYYKKIKSGELIYIDSHVGITSNKLGYYISAPVFDINKQVIAVVVCKMRPEVMHNNIAQVADTDRYNAISMFVDKYGVVLYSDDQERIYKSLAPLPEETISTFEKNKRFNNKEIGYLSYYEPKKIIDDIFLGSKTLNIYDKDDGEEEILTISSVGSYGFYLLSEIKTEYFARNSIKIALILALSVLAAVLSAILFIYIVVKRILRPLNELKQATEDIFLGNYNVKVDINTNDEFGSLGQSINKMSKSIKDYSDNIEKKINDKTAKLEKINKYMVGRELKMIELKKTVQELKDNKNENKK